jgi:anti-anti-sigma factor
MSDKTSISLGENLDISNVSKLHSRLNASLQKSSTIELKADVVKKTDSAGLQLILSIKREVEKVGGTILWKKPSKELIDTAVLLGLFEHLGLHY